MSFTILTVAKKQNPMWARSTLARKKLYSKATEPNTTASRSCLWALRNEEEA